MVYFHYCVNVIVIILSADIPRSDTLNCVLCSSFVADSTNIGLSTFIGYTVDYTEILPLNRNYLVYLLMESPSLTCRPLSNDHRPANIL